jgi:hypothetical protein
MFSSSYYSIIRERDLYKCCIACLLRYIHIQSIVTVNWMLLYRVSEKSLCTCCSWDLVGGVGSTWRDRSHVRHVRCVYVTSWITFHFQHGTGTGSIHFLQVYRDFSLTLYLLPALKLAFRRVSVLYFFNFVRLNTKEKANTNMNTVLYKIRAVICFLKSCLCCYIWCFVWILSISRPFRTHSTL